MGISSSFKKLNLDINNFDEVFSDHSIVAVTDNEGTIIDSDEHTYLVNFGYKTVRINKRALILI